MKKLLNHSSIFTQLFRPNGDQSNGYGIMYIKTHVVGALGQVYIDVAIITITPHHTAYIIYCN